MDGIPRLISFSFMFEVVNTGAIGTASPLWLSPYGTRAVYPLTSNSASPHHAKERAMGIIWTIVIGFVAGVIAKFIMPGSTNEPSGFVLTTILGIVGAFVASYLGQALGWYAPGQGAGLIGAIVGAIVVLFVWGIIAKRKT